MDSKQILSVGSIAYDTIKTPKGDRERILGGSSIFFGISASLFTKVYLIGIVGDDFSEEMKQLCYKAQIDLGIFRIVPYTPSISTTEIIRRCRKRTET